MSSVFLAENSVASVKVGRLLKMGGVCFCLLAECVILFPLVGEAHCLFDDLYIGAAAAQVKRYYAFSQKYFAVACGSGPACTCAR